MNKYIIESVKTSIPLTSFWSATHLWQTRPHLIKRKLFGVSFILNAEVQLENNIDFIQIIEFLENSEELKLGLNKKSMNDLLTSKKLFKNIYEVDINVILNNKDGLYISVKVLLPKSEVAKQQIQIDIIDKEKNIISCTTISDENTKHVISPFTFGFMCTNTSINLWLYNHKHKETKTLKWVQTKLFQKIIQWAQEAENHNENVSRSLSLISTDRYCMLYQELKKKYANNIIEIWPENTDPQKFVFEDVAIATYILILWETERLQKKSSIQSFVDIGCGNGLLVHILNQEGHPGFGVDVRRRKIWDLYPKSTKLKVAPIIPSDQSLFPETDWLIGNHSDELTPWIPVIATRSSLKCRYFVLPCCAYEFDGKKYQRLNSSCSQYSEYINYVHQISDICGFVTLKDKLRIPSTKRVCLVGAERHNYDGLNEKIQNFIDERCKTSANESGSWTKNFTVRPSTEAVRNCTQIDHAIIKKVVKLVTDKLLTKQNYINMYGKDWNCGDVLSIKEIVNMIESDELKALKNECGGVQTLLKNHHYIFQVVQGNVQFRIPVASKNKDKIKQTQCWFYLNHPDGCLLQDNDCAYKHDILK